MQGSGRGLTIDDMQGSGRGLTIDDMQLIISDQLEVPENDG